MPTVTGRHSPSSTVPTVTYRHLPSFTFSAVPYRQLQFQQLTYLLQAPKTKYCLRLPVLPSLLITVVFSFAGQGRDIFRRPVPSRALGSPSAGPCRGPVRLGTLVGLSLPTDGSWDHELDIKGFHGLQIGSWDDEIVEPDPRADISIENDANENIEFVNTE